MCVIFFRQHTHCMWFISFYIVCVQYVDTDALVPEAHKQSLSCIYSASLVTKVHVLLLLIKCAPELFTIYLYLAEG